MRRLRRRKRRGSDGGGSTRFRMDRSCHGSRSALIGLLIQVIDTTVSVSLRFED